MSEASDQQQRLAHYYFDPGRPRVTIHLPVDPNAPVAADDLGVWVAQIMESTHALTHAYELAGNQGVHLVAGSDLRWSRAVEEAPPVSRTTQDAARWRSWQTEQEEQEQRERAKLQEQLASREEKPEIPRSTKTMPTAAEYQRQKEVLYQYLLAQGDEVRLSDIVKAQPIPGLPILADQSITKRLTDLEKEGRATHRRLTNAYQNPTYWRAVPAPAAPHGQNGNGASERREEPAREREQAEPYAEVVAWTKGKTMLFWGGEPSGSETKAIRIREMEERLGLKECRWPEVPKGNDLGPLWKELQRPGLDFMVVTLFNGHQVTEQLARAAIQRGIPVFRMGRSTSVTMLLHTLREQLGTRAPLLAA